MSHIVRNDTEENEAIDLNRDKGYRTVLNTIGLLFKSRRFLTLLTTLIVSTVVFLIPQLEPLREHIAWIIGAGIFTVGAHGLEDFARAWNERDPELEKLSLRQQLEATLNELTGGIIEEMISNEDFREHVDTIVDAAVDDILDRVVGEDELPPEGQDPNEPIA